MSLLDSKIGRVTNFNVERTCRLCSKPGVIRKDRRIRAEKLCVFLVEEECVSLKRCVILKFSKHGMWCILVFSSKMCFGVRFFDGAQYGYFGLEREREEFLKALSK